MTTVPTRTDKQGRNAMAHRRRQLVVEIERLDGLSLRHDPGEQIVHLALEPDDREGLRYDEQTEHQLFSHFVALAAAAHRQRPPDRLDRLSPRERTRVMPWLVEYRLAIWEPGYRNRMGPTAYYRGV